MQGGGFAGTIQAFVPGMLTAKYHDAIEKVFGAGSCYLLRLREQGACGSFEHLDPAKQKELHTPVICTPNTGHPMLGVFLCDTVMNTK